MRTGRLLFAIGTALTLSCAAVAGIDDFDIVACPNGCADGGTADVMSTSSPPPPPVDAGHAGDAGGDAAVEIPDSAAPLLSGDAALTVPTCGVGTCPKIGGECSAEPCASPAPVWMLGQGGGEFGIEGNECVVEGDPTAQIFLAHTIDGGARYEFDLHVDIVDVPAAVFATIAVIDFGSEQALVQINDHAFRLCNHSGCTAGPTISTTTAKIEVYGLAGEGVASGIAQLIVGTSSQCAGGTSIALATPVTAAPTARVGCLGAGNEPDGGDPCELLFDNVTFSVLNL